ncbi:MAG: 1-acyl-sn-glycerol-3-phosphate acyltransferase [Anaerolineales bacterium]|nr:1-acyl-sn-glycerol-3-phosphate acyltransferase [Anaerolineales bacterium]
MSSDYRIPFHSRLLRPVLKAIFRGIFHILAKVIVSGRENVPYGQAYVVAINHVSLYDPPFAVSFWPEIAEVMGAVDVWHRPGQNVLVNLYHGIPVHRGDYDRRLIDKVLAVLRSGRPLLIAPEGERSHVPAMQRAKPGIAHILEEARVSVVPVGILGTTDDFWQRASHGQRPQIEMRIGKPFRLPPVEGKGAKRRLARQRNADLVMSHIAGLLPEAYRGVYTETAITPSPLDG